MPQCYIGFDVGTVRIGVAYGDDRFRIASPLKTIDVGVDTIKEAREILYQRHANVAVVGLPRNSHGVETAQSKVSRKFGEALTKLGITVYYQDESLTSVTAEARLQEIGKPYTKADIDKESATIILQDFLEQR